TLRGLGVLAIGVGLALRLHQLGGQIVADDEWHALHAIRDLSYVDIARHFGDSDHCIPLTLLFKLLGDAFGLGQLMMRAPVLLAGALALLVFPLLVRKWMGLATAVVFAWLLAISPLHIFYSRFARPYSISLLLAFTGVMAFLAFWGSGDKRWK